MMNEEGIIIDTNQMASQILQKDKDEIVGYPIDTVDPSFPVQDFVNFWRNIPFDEQLIFETTHITKNGIQVPVEVSGKKFNIDDKTYYFGIARDITERKKAEETILKNQYYLTKAQEIGSIGTWELDIIKNKLIWTAQNYRNFGVPEGTALNYELFLECVHPEDRDFVNEKWNEAIKGNPYDIEHRLLVDGEIRWLREKADITFDDDGNAIKAIGVTQNITERKQAEIKLINSEKKFKTLANTSPVGIYLTDSNGHCTYANPKLLEMVGLTEKDVIGKGWQNAIHPDDLSKVAEKWKHCLKDGSTYNDELRFVDKNGNVIWIKGIANSIKDDNGNIVGYVGINADITGIKESEFKLKESEERYRSLVDTVNSGVAIYKVINDGKSGSDYIIQDFNQFALNHEKMEKKDVVGKSLKDIRPNIDEYGLIDTFRKVWKSGEPTFFPAKVYVDDKYSNYYENRVFKLPSGEIVAVYDDVTERMIAEEKLKKSENKLKSIFNTAPNGIQLSDRDGKIIFSNPAHHKIQGYENGKLVGKYIWDFMLKENVEQTRDYYEHLFTDKPEPKPFYNKDKTQDGRIIDVKVDWDYIYDDSGEVDSILSIISDITERKKNEEELNKIKWLLTQKPQIQSLEENGQPYGDLTELNRDRTILNSVGKEMLKNIVNDYLGLLETSAAVYEKNGDYALGIFSSGWCKLLDRKAWELTGEKNVNKALDSGKWLCHESCWSKSSLTSIKTGKPTDIRCHGGINIYAYPIFAFNEVVGSINFGYGNPPNDMETLAEISKKYDIPMERLKEEATAYNSRPSYIVDLAKEKLQTSAKIIGTLVELNFTRKQLQESENKLLEAQKLSHIGNWEYITETDMVTWSKELFNIFERSQDLPAPKYSEQKAFYTEESFAKLDCAVQECIQKGTPYDIELDIITSRGSIKHIISNGRVKKDDKNQIIGAYGTALDITDRKKSEETVKKSEERYRFLAEKTSDLIILLNKKGEFEYISPIIKEITGYTAEEYKSFTNTANVLPEDQHILNEGMAEIANGSNEQMNE